MKALEKISITQDPLIYVIRGQKVMLDADVAKIYGVSTKRLNEQVKRNRRKFPARYMFQLTEKEHAVLIAQYSESKWGGRRNTPFAFTEHGAVMLATVLNSPKAVKASMQVVDAFVRLRKIIHSKKELAEKILELEKKYDKQFAVVFDAIKQVIQSPKSVREKIGYKRNGE